MVAFVGGVAHMGETNADSSKFWLKSVKGRDSCEDAADGKIWLKGRGWIGLIRLRWRVLVNVMTNLRVR
jgi:hypothetical protein